MNLEKPWQLAIFIILLIAFSSACGPAVPGAGNNEATPIIAPAGAGEKDARGIEVGFTTDGRPYRGNPDAPVVVEAFSDYQCPFCGRFASQTLPQLDESQIAGGEAVLIYYDFPLTSIHPQAMAAANAARCAGEQGAAAYWAMHDLLFATISDWSNNNATAMFSNYARDLGLDMGSFNQCLVNNQYYEQIEVDVLVGQSRGVTSTPTFFLNNQPLVGAQPIDTFNSAIAIVRDGGQLAGDEPVESVTQPVIVPTPAVIPVAGVLTTLGNPQAPVTIVEYTDYQCPYCRQHAIETMPLILSEMIETGDVYYVLKDFPLDQLHPEARAASVAAYCAGEQEAYWEMHDALFETQAQWGNRGSEAGQVFAGLATEIGLESVPFSQCLESGRYDDLIQANLEEGSALGVSGTPHFFINGYPLSGAQPFPVFEYGVGLAAEGRLAEAYTRQEPPPEPDPSRPVDVAIDSAYSIGRRDAPVIIVEFTDFQCPYCGRHFNQTFGQIKTNYIDTGLVRYVFKDFPLTNIHPQAVKAAEAARCAGDQEAYLEMHHLLFSNQQQWGGRSDVVNLFTGYAAQLGLETESFSQCLSQNTYEAAVMADLQEGVNLGIRGTPAFFLNGHYLSGAQPYQVFEQAINSLLDR